MSSLQQLHICKNSSFPVADQFPDAIKVSSTLCFVLLHPLPSLHSSQVHLLLLSPVKLCMTASCCQDDGKDETSAFHMQFTVTFFHLQPQNTNKKLKDEITTI
jgi:hypothetical protein